MPKKRLKKEKDAAKSSKDCLQDGADETANKDKVDSKPAKGEKRKNEKKGNDEDDKNEGDKRLHFKMMRKKSSCKAWFGKAEKLKGKRWEREKAKRSTTPESEGVGSEDGANNEGHGGKGSDEPLPDRLTNWCGDVRYSRETWSILALYEKAPRNLGYLRNGLYSRGEEEGHHVTCSINVRREDREVKRVSEFSSRVVTRSVKLHLILRWCMFHRLLAMSSHTPWIDIDVSSRTPSQLKEVVANHRAGLGSLEDRSSRTQLLNRKAWLKASLMQYKQVEPFLHIVAFCFKSWLAISTVFGQIMNLCKQQDDCVLATTEPIVVAAMCEHILSKRSSMHAITIQSLLAVGEACCSGWMRLNINQFWMWSHSCVVANPHINWGMSKQVSNSLMFAIGLQSPYRCMWRWFMNRLLPARSQTCINEWDLECRCLIAKHFWNGYASCCWVSLTLMDCKTQSWVWATYWWDVQDCYRLKNLGQKTRHCYSRLSSLTGSWRLSSKLAVRVICTLARMSTLPPTNAVANVVVSGLASTEETWISAARNLALGFNILTIPQWSTLPSDCTEPSAKKKFLFTMETGSCNSSNKVCGGGVEAGPGAQ